MTSLHRLRRAALRLSARAVLCTAGLLALARPAHAQDETPPEITFSPGGGTFQSPTVTVTIDWEDSESRLVSPRSVLLNGVDVTSSFPVTAITALHWRATGTITLPARTS